MNLELILWIVAGVIISEILFVIALRTNFMLKPKKRTRFDWIGEKVGCLLMGSLFMGLQYGITLIDTGDVRYINLLYEFLIIGGICFFFWINYLIQKKIGKRNSKK